MRLLILFLFISLSINAQRSTGVEIEVDINLIPIEIIESDTTLDIEYSSKEGYYILWIHQDTTYKPFLVENFDILYDAKSAYNRITKTDNLNLYQESDTILKEYDINVNGINYKNIKFSELDNVYIGDTVQYGDEMYKARQSHYSEEWHEPSNILALWLRISTDSLWYASVEYDVNDTAWYDSIPYRCIQAHISQTDWRPDYVPALWGEISLADGCDNAKEWDASDHWTSYTLGDLRLNNGSLWKVINVAFTYYEPSSVNGVYGWEFVEICQ